MPFFERLPAPIDPRARRPERPEPRSEVLVHENLFSALVAGPTILASISAAAFLQHVLPAWRVGAFPMAGLVGLVSGWLLVLPVGRWLARRIDPARIGLVAFATAVSGVIWVTPAACFGESIGWAGGAARVYVAAALISMSGLIWGGYLDLDAAVGE